MARTFRLTFSIHLNKEKEMYDFFSGDLVASVVVKTGKAS